MREEVDGIAVPPPPLSRSSSGAGRYDDAVLESALLVSPGWWPLAPSASWGCGTVDGVRRLDGDVRIADEAPALSSYNSEGAYAIGNELVLGDNRFDWPEPIKALHYTSAGVVIQSGDNPDRDEGGSAYALVTPTGEWSTIDVTLDDQIVGFETTSTHFAYAEPAGDGFDLVVHDAASDEELARTSIDLGTTTIAWRAPPPRSTAISSGSGATTAGCNGTGARAVSV